MICRQNFLTNINKIYFTILLTILLKCSALIAKNDERIWKIEITPIKKDSLIGNNVKIYYKQLFETFSLPLDSNEKCILLGNDKVFEYQHLECGNISIRLKCKIKSDSFKMQIKGENITNIVSMSCLSKSSYKKGK